MKNKELIEELYNIITNRKNSPMEGSYTNYLFEKGTDKILKKLGEESTELVIAAKNNSDEEIINEVCDLIYHLIVLLAEKNIELVSIEEELDRRRKKIGNRKPERKQINTI